MKKKGILSLVLALVMVFSVLTPAFASGLSDVEGTEYETAVGRLAALGIMQGYEDGTFRVEKNITRAEFSTLVARSLGLEQTAKASAGTTKFSDVKADHWASGYINLAVAKGIIKGYPNGTFKPEANVTYAEAITMLVRTVGYSPAIETMNWPTNYITKAAEIGIIGNVGFINSDAANRGNVAALLGNTLEVDLMEQVGYGDEKTWEEKEGKTLLTEYLNVHELEEAIVAQTSGYSNGKLDADEVVINYEGKSYTFKIKNNVGVDHLLGHEVTVLVKDVDNDNKVEDDELLFFANSTTDEKDVVAWDYIVGVGQDANSAYKFKDGGMTVSLDATDDTFDVSKDAAIYYNHERISDLKPMTDAANYLGEVAGKVILNDDDEVIFMNMFNYDNPVVATEINVNDEKIKYFNKTEAESTLKLDGETYTIYKNGAISSLSELAADDVLYIWKLTDNSYAIQAYDYKISGTLTDVYSDGNNYWDYVLVVDGKKIYVGPNFTLSLDNNDNVDLLGKIINDENGMIAKAPVTTETLSDLEDMVGSEVTVFIGKYYEGTEGWNYGRHVVSSVDSKESNYFMITEKPWSSRTAGTNYYIELVNKNDQEIVYQLTEEDTLFDGTELNLADSTKWNTVIDDTNGFIQGTLVDVEFNNDGTISSIEKITTLAQANLSSNNINQDLNRILLKDATSTSTWFYVTEETAIFDSLNNEAVDWDSLEDINVNFDVLAAKVDGKELESLVVKPASGTIGTSDYGLVLKRSVKSDGLYVTMAIENRLVDLYAGDLGNKNDLLEGTLWNVTISAGELESAKSVTDGGVDILPTKFDGTNSAYEIVSGGVDTRNGIIEVIVKGGDEDADDHYFIDVDQYGEDTYYYDIDSSWLSTDASKKILSLETLTDGDIIKAYDLDNDGIFDFIVVVDR